MSQLRTLRWCDNTERGLTDGLLDLRRNSFTLH
jgi:hypothetical protein